MSADSGVARTTEPQRSRPWSMLFRIFELSRDLYKIIIAIGAVIILTIGWTILGWIFGIGHDHHGTWPANADRGPNPFLVVTTPAERSQLFTWQLWFGQKDQDPPLQVEPFRQFYQPVIDLVHYSPIGHGWQNWWYSMFGVVFTLIIWGMAAGAITRIAAMQLARNERIGLGEALGYARRKLFDFIIGPAIPLIIFAILALLNALGTFILTVVPYLGSVLTAILLPLPILSSLVMAVMLVAFIGWPLFYATISVEGSDSFDALSRTLAYITQGAWSYIKYAVFAFVFSVVVVFLVVLLASGSIYIVRWSMGLAPGLSWQDTGDPVGSSFALAPCSYQWRDLLVGRDHPIIRIHQTLNEQLLQPGKLLAFQKGLVENKPLNELLDADIIKRTGFGEKPPQGTELAVLKDFYTGKKVDDLRDPQSKFNFLWSYMNGGQKLAAYITGFWTHGLFLLLVGFAYCLFWCSGTVIYFLLRKQIDETEFDDVYIEDEQDFAPPPLVSTPSAADQGPVAPPPVLPITNQASVPTDTPADPPGSTPGS
ncbi:MAG: hypothetical protein JNJ77_12825 [Planctomycetia bacterium]|nr:hypothetical protein [Planctomycetia bacterium]